MKIGGVVQNGVVVLDEPCGAPDGTRVEVELEFASDQDQRTWAEIFEDIAGKAEGLPPDYAMNHDHYLHGLPKR